MCCELFKETLAVFFMRTVVRRCIVGDTKLEEGRQFCLMQRAAKRAPDKTAWAGERFGVGGWGRVWMNIECRRESKSKQRKVLLAGMERGNKWKVRTLREEEMWKEKINTYLQQCVFLSLHRDLVQNINGDSTTEMAMWKTKSVAWRGQGRELGRAKQSPNRQMRKINHGMRDETSSDMGGKTVASNGELWHTGGTDKEGSNWK